VRECNVVLRWFLLHRTTTHKQFGEYINGTVKTEVLMHLLTQTAQLEFRVR
jgi:hypothetical protein